MEIETLIEMGMLSRIPPDAGLAGKEWAECKTDLKEAKKEMVEVAAQFAKRMEELAGKISDRKKIKGGKEK